MAEKEDVIALRRKLSQTDVPASVFCKTSAKRVSRFVRDYFDAETAASRPPTQLGLMEAARATGLNASRKQLRLELRRHVTPKRGARRKPSRQFAEK
jgi:hypothetical protein